MSAMISVSLCVCYDQCITVCLLYFSHATVRGYAEGLVTIDITEFVDSSKSQFPHKVRDARVGGSQINPGSIF